MTPDPLYRAFFDLLVPAGGGPPAALADPDPAQRARIMALAEAEKCLPNLLSLWQRTGRLDDAEAARHAILQAKHRSSQQVTAALPEQAVLLKGESVRYYYPPEVERFTVDVDLMVDSLRDLGAVHDGMRSLAYVAQGSGLWGMRLRPGLPDGVASVRYWTPEPREDAVTVEVQVGGFPLTTTRVLPFAELARGAVRRPGCRFLSLSPTHQLLLALADYGVRLYPITVRHLADLAHLARAAGAEIDLDEVCRQVQAHDLQAGVGRLARAIDARGLREALPAPLPSQLAQIEGLAPARRRPGRAAMASLGAAALMRCAAPLAKAQGDGLAGRLLRYAPLVSFVLNAGHRVYGIPVSSKGVDVPSVMRVDRTLYFANGAGIYALALSGEASNASRRLLFDRLKLSRQPLVVSRMEPSR